MDSNQINYGQILGNNNGDDKPKKKKPTIIIITAIVLIICIIVACAFVFLESKSNRTTSNNETNTNATSTNITDNNSVNEAQETTTSLFYVYDMDYSAQAGEIKNGYFGDHNKYYGPELINVPYINLDSNDASVANNTIHDFYNRSIELYNTYASNGNGYVTVDYKYFLNGDILSVVIKQTDGGKQIEDYKYLTFNFNVKTKQKLSFSDIYSIPGFSNSTISPTVKYEISNSKFFETYGSLYNQSNLESSKSATYQDFSNKISSNSNIDLGSNISYFLNSKGELEVAINYTIPNYGTLTRLLTINKSNERSEVTSADENNSVKIVDENGNLDLSDYVGYYADVFPSTTSQKDEAYIYKKDDKWYMNYATRKAYSGDDQKLVELDDVELKLESNQITFELSSKSFRGKLTINKDGTISIKIDSAENSTNITPETVTLKKEDEPGISKTE